ncbi:hypothetical protein OOK36_55715 [Streptomyces sp. NBC_00365]|nr:hypothetical protein [Streptomyces sp. NBC_00365]MCX5097705.1 hypothetical protein [Streptomyces sp. NBC_00365]
MDSVLRTQARFGQRALLLTAAVPLTGWTEHAIAPGTGVWGRAV